MQHSQSELISASAKTHFTTANDPKRSPDEILRSLDSLETRKWFLHSALDVIQKGSEALPEFKNDVRKLFLALQSEIDKNKATIEKETEIQNKVSEELARVQSEAKQIIRDIRTELPGVAEEHKQLEDQIAAATVERDKLLKVNRATPWYNETVIMEKELQGLEQQKKVLLSKLRILDNTPPTT